MLRGDLFSSLSSISDKQIVHRSGFMNLLEQKLSLEEILPGDAIMADKGFDQFEESDVIKTQTIAQHRIHVERAIGKVRRFGIFSSQLISCGQFVV